MTWFPLPSLLHLWHWMTWHPFDDRSANYSTGAVWCRCGARLGPGDSP